jgi:hypothetical protein
VADGRVRVAAERCATCIFRSVEGGLVPLTAACVAGLVGNAEANDQAMICHERYDAPAACRGFYNLSRPPARLRRAKEQGLVEFTDA